MAEPKKLGYWDDYFRPVGYTDDDVRDLVAWVRTEYPADAPPLPILTPFSAMLAERTKP